MELSIVTKYVRNMKKCLIIMSDYQETVTEFRRKINVEKKKRKSIWGGGGGGGGNRHISNAKQTQMRMEERKGEKKYTENTSFWLSINAIKTSISDHAK